MSRYIRAFVPGGTVFFTVTLLELWWQLLFESIDDLRAVYVDARQLRPFTVDVIVVQQTISTAQPIDT